MADYQRIQLDPYEEIGPPGPLPLDLQGLQDVSLADLPLAVGEAACAELGYLNTGFIPTPVPTPVGMVSKVQLFLAAHQLAILDDLIAGQGVLPTELRIIWDWTTYFYRQQPLILAIAAQVGLDDAALDELFALAATMTE